MRTTIIVTAVLLLLMAGCSSQGGSLVPVRAVGSASGDATGPQVFVAGIPMNALVRIHGNVSYTIQVMPPYVTLDGDYTIVVEPQPGRELEAQTAIARGDLLIRRAGVAGALNAPGSIAAYKAALMKAYSRPVSRAAPASDVVCCGDNCSLPTTSTPEPTCASSP